MARVVYLVWAVALLLELWWGVDGQRRRRGVMVASPVGPARLVRDVLLRDGWTLRLQTPMPVDFEDIRAFYDGLSEDSRYLRFHGFGRTDAIARADAEASGVDRLALIGRHEGRVVAVASCDGLREPGVAEVAFAVADEDQRRGIGMRMLEQLAALAAERGIHRFVAEVVGRNELMLGVFEHAGFAVRRRGSGGELMVSFDIAPTKALQDRIDATMSRRSLRCVRCWRRGRSPWWVLRRTRRAWVGGCCGASSLVVFAGWCGRSIVRGGSSARRARSARWRICPSRRSWR